jgi:hypothetical protein
VTRFVRRQTFGDKAIGLERDVRLDLLPKVLITLRSPSHGCWISPPVSTTARWLG